MEPTAAEARAVVAELERRAAERRRRWQPAPLPAPPVRTPMTVNESLHYLHTHWVLPDHFTDVPPGPPWKRRLWRGAGRFVFGVLSRYLTDERDLLSKAVQVCDTLARRVDTLEAELDQLAAATSRQLAELATYLPDAAGSLPDAAGSVPDVAGDGPLPAGAGTGDPAGADDGGTDPAGDRGDEPDR